MPDPELARELPFASGDSAWNVTVTGDWTLDNERGREHAAAYIHFMGVNRSAKPLLGFIVRDMIGAGQFTGIEVGFFQTLSEAISRPATP